LYWRCLPVILPTLEHGVPRFVDPMLIENLHSQWGEEEVAEAAARVKTAKCAITICAEKHEFSYFCMDCFNKKGAFFCSACGPATHQCSRVDGDHWTRAFAVAEEQVLALNSSEGSIASFFI